MYRYKFNEIFFNNHPPRFFLSYWDLWLYPFRHWQQEYLNLSIILGDPAILSCNLKISNKNVWVFVCRLEMDAKPDRVICDWLKIFELAPRSFWQHPWLIRDLLHQAQGVDFCFCFFPDGTEFPCRPYFFRMIYRLFSYSSAHYLCIGRKDYCRLCISFLDSPKSWLILRTESDRLWAGIHWFHNGYTFQAIALCT